MVDLFALENHTSRWVKTCNAEGLTSIALFPFNYLQHTHTLLGKWL